MNFDNLTAYKLLRQEKLQDLNAEGYLLRHIKSGARIFLVSNDDENKVFTIGFRTPPANSTGVAHIMEHSVLCGSAKFPLKDPFVELAKGSLNTFLNAMTYPDKTVYPVASCNEKDFQNLMDVYMDAVLHPNIYKTDKTFRQEGWHYEMEDKDSPLTINGVVYNEMRGVFSSADSVLERQVFSSLYPDTSYGVESGGDPDVIPELTYEEYLDFHRTYYHPSNSYIYLYGDMDMEEKLQWLDEAYLKDYDAIDPGSEIKKQAPFEEPRSCEFPYAVEEDSDDGAYLTFAVSVGDVLESNQYLAWNMLDYALLDAPGAPLKEALINKKLCKDVTGGTDTGLLQPYFTVTAKNADPSRMDEFVETIEEVLRDQVNNGLNKRTLAASLNSTEFRVREADFGSAPKGLVYGLQCFDSWLYDENDPFMHLKFGDVFHYLRAHMEDGYFEGLIRDYLLDNPHQIRMVMYPEKGLAAKKDKALGDKLAALKASLSEEQIEEIIRSTKELKEYQEEEDSPEVKALIPLLSREDIGKETAPEYNELRHEKGGDVMFHELFTGGITYLRILFDVNGLSAEELQYASLLRSVFNMVNTEHYTYGELADEIGINCGGIGMGLGSFTSCDSSDRFIGAFQLTARMMADKADFVFDMFREILFTSDLTDKKRIGDLISMISTRLQMSLPESGHGTAIGRANAAISLAGQFSELNSGVEYARFITNLDRHYDELADEISEKLQAVRCRIFRASRMFTSVTTDKAGYEYIPGLLEKFAEEVEKFHPEDKAVSSEFRKEPMEYDFSDVFGSMKKGGHYALTTPGQVQYVACCGNYHDGGKEYDAALRVLSVILGFDYLWLNVRVKGGAYGCMNAYYRCGDGYMVSYRDPNLKDTLEVYKGVTEYIRNFDADEREMTKYIIGTISDMDTPKTPRTKGYSSLTNWLCGVSHEKAQEARDRVLSCQAEDIRGLAGHLQAILDNATVVVLGSESKIEEDKELFDVTEPLFTKA